MAAPFLAPEGFKPCQAGDPVAIIEARLAAKLGGDFLGCFQSDPTAAGTNPVQPAEYAFALALHDRVYAATDLHELLSKVEQQWKGFKPVDGKLPESYVDELNKSIKEKGDGNDKDLRSVRPVLVKIDGNHKNYYTVTSIRTYALGAGDAGVTAVKVNADAVVLHNSRLVRLTIQRNWSGSTDVARTQADIDRWAKSIE